MTGRGSVQYGNISPILFLNLQHSRIQISGIEGNGLSRFQIDFESEILLHSQNAALEAFNVIALPGDVMTATEIDPLHILEPSPELEYHLVKSDFKIIGILFAESVEMQAVQKFKKLWLLLESAA